MNTLPKLMIVGKIPPPYGGVTVHINRLVQYLHANNYPFQFCDLAGSSNTNSIFIRCQNAIELVWNLLSKKYDIVHCHASNPLLLLLVDFVVARVLNRKTIYTLHGEGNLLLCESGHLGVKLLLRGALKRAARIITINCACYERAIKFAASPKNVLLMTAYLPPTLAEKSLQLHSDDLEHFFATHDMCFASQGTFGNEYNGVDLYRFDLLGEALAAIRTKYPKAGLCTFVSQALNPLARERVFALRGELGLEEDWLILENFGPAIPVYARCLAFIRPTMSDGDSLSIRECLDLGIPVIASNAVPRPDGCLLFERGDLASLVSSIFCLLSDYPAFRQEAEQTITHNCLEPLLDCYSTINY